MGAPQRRIQARGVRTPRTERPRVVGSEKVSILWCVCTSKAIVPLGDSVDGLVFIP